MTLKKLTGEVEQNFAKFIQGVENMAGLTESEMHQLAAAVKQGQDELSQLQERRQRIVAVKPIPGEMFKLASALAPTKLSIAISSALNFPVPDLLLTYVGEQSGYIHRETLSV